MKRDIISIDEDKCVGCGLCINACHQGALQLIDGKAKLVSESYCDGLGKCLPNCPTGAMKVISKEADEFDEAHEKAADNGESGDHSCGGESGGCGCSSTESQVFDRSKKGHETLTPLNSLSTMQPLNTLDTKPKASASQPEGDLQSELMQWPCQIKLVPTNAPYFKGAKLLIAADCTAFANANVHSKFMKNKITLIGCPKLDEGDYAEKLGEIIKNNDIKSVDVLRMSVPCCGGMENAVKQALINSGKMIPWQVITISTDGSILED